jgi:ribosomal protein L24
MVKTRFARGDKVHIVRGEASRTLRDEKGLPQVCTILKVDRVKGRVWVEVPRPKMRLGERETPMRGVEVWKTARYNPQRGEAGGLKVVKRPIHVSNLKLVEKAPAREFIRG